MHYTLIKIRTEKPTDKFKSLFTHLSPITAATQVFTITEQLRNWQLGDLVAPSSVAMRSVLILNRA